MKYFANSAAVAICLCFLAAQTLSAQQVSVDVSEIDKIFSDYAAGTPGCAVGVTEQGTLIFSKGYGEANLDYGIPIEPDSRFMIASISKQFAAASLLMLEQEGLLNPDEDLRTYIPELPEFEHIITPRHLIHHTSGLRDMFNLLSLADIGLDDTTTPEQTLEMVGRQQRLNFEPGSEYLYSNTGYFLMSVLVENVSGMTLREYANRHFFEPLGMNSTHFHDDTRMIVPNRAESYTPTADGHGRFYRDNLDRVGARGLFTTIEDFAKWDANFIENRSHLENFTEKMTTRGITLEGDTLDYASALRISRYKTLDTVGHGGNYMGFRTNYMRFPDYQLGLIVFCNRSNINPAAHARDLADLYLEEVFTDRFREYTGSYRSARPAMNAEYRVIVEEGDIYLQLGMNGIEEKERLVWQGDDEFTTGGRDVVFLRNSPGEIDGLQIQTSRTAPITFKKRLNDN